MNFPANPWFPESYFLSGKSKLPEFTWSTHWAAWQRKVTVFDFLPFNNLRLVFIDYLDLDLKALPFPEFIELLLGSFLGLLPANWSKAPNLGVLDCGPIHFSNWGREPLGYFSQPCLVLVENAWRSLRSAFRCCAESGLPHMLPTCVSPRRHLQFLVFVAHPGQVLISSSSLHARDLQLLGQHNAPIQEFQSTYFMSWFFVWCMYGFSFAPVGKSQ